MQDQSIRLMDLSHGAGCGCKMGPEDLHEVLSKLRNDFVDKRVLVGYDTGDDAAVLQISPDMAIVQTADFFTPIMNDPYRFGQVAAANALSDIYAMGAEALSAISLLAFPIKKLGTKVLQDILQGGMDKVHEAGISLVGGHSIDDPEPKYGLSVTGTIHPQKIIRNRGIQNGDRLVLTKPIGTGVLTTAIKRNLITQELEDLVFSTMSSLNLPSSKAMQDCFLHVHAATDITGFGLAGHLFGMLKNGNLKARIFVDQIPVLQGVTQLIHRECIPGGTIRNYNYVSSVLDSSAIKHPVLWERILCDPQTSGGMLIAVQSEGLEDLLLKLSDHKAICAEVIGDIVETKDQHKIEII
ncbi:MAG: selenide, water dikinase SelD [Oligoflexales bacterium]|nr:selenide, water dikinase SelD [Oligoflexales bacterium]